MEVKLTYKEAFCELKELIERLESDEVAIDELIENIRRAETLIGVCKTALTEFEDKSKEIFERLEEHQNQETEN
ncbi:MAG: exodeoxyribonuclease VII small subunit [Bacteroidales bacterium]|jgi:exodeoxyribonuclease VII small subunit|nr:exodeoxyribonuclease VII small subunit [Bacteroidales bacterium]